MSWVHGCLLRAWGTGVLLTGTPGIGKSRLALELVRSGQRLVADDAIELVRSEGELFGRCPAGFSGLLAVRGLGILDVARLYGDTAIAAATPLQLIVRLQPEAELADADPLDGRRDLQVIDGIALPRLTLAAAPAPAQVGLLDAACRDARLRRAGCDPLANRTVARRAATGCAELRR